MTHDFYVQYRNLIPHLHIIYFYRDSHGNEIDLLYASGRELVGIEIKSSHTFTPHFKKTLLLFSEKQHALYSSYVIYNGEKRHFTDGVKAINFKSTSNIFDSTL
ncbi:hypothetical protein AB833_13135 [Chromatiales bacterium (ex Bugula neritina AB1)]|nr:hypothetical protein AB833_13135 [Chromatiales bacterium (ex Bugula neritina AB1)]